MVARVRYALASGPPAASVTRPSPSGAIPTALLAMVADGKCTSTPFLDRIDLNRGALTEMHFNREFLREWRAQVPTELSNAMYVGSRPRISINSHNKMIFLLHIKWYSCYIFTCQIWCAYPTPKLSDFPQLGCNTLSPFNVKRPSTPPGFRQTRAPRESGFDRATAASEQTSKSTRKEVLINITTWTHTTTYYYIYISDNFCDNLVTANFICVTIFCLWLIECIAVHILLV